MKNPIQINEKDRLEWLFMMGATIFGMSIIAIAIVWMGLPSNFSILPPSWFVGAFMSWLYGKYIHNEIHK